VRVADLTTQSRVGNLLPRQREERDALYGVHRCCGIWSGRSVGGSAYASRRDWESAGPSTLSLSLFVALATCAVTPQPAMALHACGNPDINLFWSNPTFGWFGSQSSIFLNDRTIDNAQCGANSIPYGSTARVRFTTQGSATEVGYERYKDQFGTLGIRAFTEYAVCTTTSCTVQQIHRHYPGVGVPAGCFSLNTTDRWRVAQGNPNTTWSFYVDCGGGSFSFIRSYATTYTSGQPESEIFKRGNQTGMVDTHSELRYKNSNGVWVYFTDVNCTRDYSSQYNGSKISSTSWRGASAASGGTSCAPNTEPAGA